MSARHFLPIAHRLRRRWVIDDLVIACRSGTAATAALAGSKSPAFSPAQLNFKHKHKLKLKSRRGRIPAPGQIGQCARRLRA
jgi:hypothetical protein